jgi:uncharacterized repeat protein (TIGR02543 family)
MTKKARFWGKVPRVCLALGLTLAVFAGACKALVNDETGEDYLMPLPGGVIVRYETGKGSYVPYESGLAPDDKITKPSDPTWPGGIAIFDGWFKDNLTFYDPWDFTNDTIPQDAGKIMTLYAQWKAATTERWVARNWIWENQGSDIMGQVAKLEQGESYTLYIKCWMQGGAPTQHNHVVAFCLDPDTGSRVYSVREQIFPNNLWAEYTYTFTAKNEWYVAGVYPGLATSGGGTFYTREIKLTKSDGSENLLRRSDFKFGVGLDEDKTYFTQAYLSNALTKDGKSDSFVPGTWYFGSSRFGLIQEQTFWNDSAVISKIAEQGGSVYLED